VFISIVRERRTPNSIFKNIFRDGKLFTNNSHKKLEIHMLGTIISLLYKDKKLFTFVTCLKLIANTCIRIRY